MARCFSLHHFCKFIVFLVHFFDGNKSPGTTESPVDATLRKGHRNLCRAFRTQYVQDLVYNQHCSLQCRSQQELPYITDTRNNFRLPSGRPSQALIHSWFKLNIRKADVDKMKQNATNFSTCFKVFFASCYQVSWGCGRKEKK